MGFVIDGFMAVTVALLVTWAWSLGKSLKGDQVAARERARQIKEAQAKAKREARLYRKGEPLRCLGCDATFPGPLTDDGCPHCHISSLVVTDADFRRSQKEETQCRPK